MEKIIISGATGMIGSHLCQKISGHYQLFILTRDVERARYALGQNHEYIAWHDNEKIIGAIASSYAIINLSGENIGKKRWSVQFKKEIIDSRVESGKTLASLVSQSPKKPKLFIQASAIGYYTHDYEKEYDENSPCSNNTFLHQVSLKWEQSSKSVEQHGTRHIVIRLGLVADKNKGFFPAVDKQFQNLTGGIAGNGKQWISWIHIDDVSGIIMHLLKEKEASGIYNVTSPNPLIYKDFCKQVSRYSRKPAWLRVPAFILKIMMGQMAEETLLISQKVMPKRVLETGYRFAYKNIEDFIKQYYRKR